jgi:hypothetical protein
MPPVDPELQKRLAETEQNLKRTELERDSHKLELEKSTSAIKDRDLKISQLQADIAVLTQKNLDFTKTIGDTEKARPMIKVDDLARQLGDAIQTINEEAKKKLIEGKAHVLVDQFEVEIKGGIDVKDGIRLTQLQGQELNSESVSTIRFALKQIPVITIVDEELKKK